METVKPVFYIQENGANVNDNPFLAAVAGQRLRPGDSLYTWKCDPHICVMFRKEESMERQNVTLSLPKSLLKKAKVLAKKEKSLSQIFKETIEEKVMEDSGYEKARERQLRLLRTGLHLGTHGRVSYSREDLHARG